MRDSTAPFHNRFREREILRAALASKRSELFILYGRRGVGKSALLGKVLSESGHPFLYFRATRRALPHQLDDLTRATRDAFPGAFLAQPFASVAVFLEFVIHLAEHREANGDRLPVLVALDEVPYLADVDRGFLTQLQHWWDDNKRRPNLKIVLSGSALSFMERQVLDAGAPLYNRRTGAMKLSPMDYAEAALFFPAYTAEDRLIAYAILGGMPSYLEQFDPAEPIEANVLRTILSPSTYLSEEPDWLLRGELRRDVLYGSILRAVAAGERRPSGIARAIGKTSAQDVAPALETLRDLDLLVREVPVTKELTLRSRGALYRIADPYLDFYYRFIDGNRGLVERGLGRRVWEQGIVPGLHRYVSHPAFERACRQYLWRALSAGALPDGLSFSRVGGWWGAGDREIDLLGVDDRDQVTVAGSCEWTNAPMDVGDYAALDEDLRQNGLAATNPEEIVRILFSRSGFTERLEEIASRSRSRLLLVDPPMMYSV